MTAYTVVPGSSGGFAVEIQSEGHVDLVEGFETEKEAQRWMVDHQRTEKAATTPRDDA